MNKRISVDKSRLKPSFEPVDFNRLYITGMQVAGLDALQGVVTINALRGEGLESEKTKDASLHTAHINRLIYR